MLVNPEKAFQSKSSPEKAKAGNSFVSVYVDLTSFTSRRCQGSQSITIDSGPQMELFQVVLTPYIKYYLNPSLPSTQYKDLLPTGKQGIETGRVSSTIVSIEKQCLNACNINLLPFTCTESILFWELFLLLSSLQCLG